MYISEIKIDGYKNCNIKSTISFNPRLNILVGENASGKTTIIDAIRMILRDSEQKYVTEDDFYKSFDNEEQRKNVLIDLKMGNLSPEERITFLSWCNAEFEAELHLEIEKEPNQKGYFKKSIWGGKSKSSAFEEETFDYIDTIYLPALRNAEEKLTNGKKSRLALLLKHQYKDEVRKKQLVDAFSEFNQSIIKNEDNKYSEIEQAKKDMGSMLDYIDKLNELDTTGVEPMSHVFPVNNVFREDVVVNGDEHEKILANAPEEKDQSFKVPRTVE